MSNQTCFTMLLPIFLIAGSASGYEQATHAALTREAYVRSQLGAPPNGNASVSDLALRLGFGPSQVGFLGASYIDMTASGPILRDASPANYNSTFSSGILKETIEETIDYPEPQFAARVAHARRHTGG